MKGPCLVCEELAAVLPVFPIALEDAVLLLLNVSAESVDLALQPLSLVRIPILVDYLSFSVLLPLDEPTLVEVSPLYDFKAVTVLLQFAILI